MKHPSAYYLLLLYAVFSCKPFLPALQDTWAHLFFEAHHLATVHQHQGCHHVAHELEKAAHDNADTTAPAAKAFESLPAHVPPQEQIRAVYFTAPTVFSLAPPARLPKTFSNIHTPPPKA